MNIALALLLAPTLTNLIGVKLTFQDMLDSAQVVVMGKVDSIWYTLDTTNATINCKPYQLIGPWTHISAEILTLYVKEDSFSFPQNTIHIVEQGGVYPDGSIQWIEGSVNFQQGEVFLAAIENQRNRWLHSETERLYIVPTAQWKYCISGDSVHLFWGEKPLPLAEVINSLSSNFTGVKQ